MTPLKRLSLVIIPLMLAACSGLAGEPEMVATFAPQPTPLPIEVENPDDLGEAVFVARCASCHGETGMGDGAVTQNAGVAVPNFLDPDVPNSQTLQDWTNTIRYGRLENLMPPWDDALSDDEIAAVAAYSYTLWENEAVLAMAAASGASDVPDAGSTTVASALPETTGTISGTITQGTSDAALPDEISLGLHVLDSNNDQVQFHINDLSDDVATFVFEDVAINSAYSYMITAIHGDAVFYSQTVQGNPAEPEITLPLTIFESTHDPAVIEQDLLVMMLTQEVDTLVVQQFMRFNNTSDRVYHTENQINTFAFESLRMTLPEGAYILNAEALGERFLVLDGDTQPILVDTRPLMPQSPEIVEVVYALPMASVGGALDIQFPLPYDLTAQPEVFIAPETHRFVGEGYESQGTRAFDFGNYDQWLGTMASAGDVVAYRVETVRQPTLTINPFAIILMSAGVSLVLVGGFFIIRKPFQKADRVTRESLLQEILDLDAQYEAGTLDETTYKAQRERLKQQLAAFAQD